MKKLVIMLALGFAIVGTSYAQSNKGNSRNLHYLNEDRTKRIDNHFDRDHPRSNASPEEIARRKSEDFADRYDLNRSQKRKLEKVNLRFEREKQTLQKRNNHMSDRRYQREMQHIRQDWEKDLKGILTRRQYEQYRDRHN